MWSWRPARAYPVYELGWAASNFARQLVLFSPGMGFQERIAAGRDGHSVPGAGTI